MQNIKTRFISNTIFFFLVYAIMFYVVVRAVSMVMTHDEAYSFYNVKHFWWVETLCTGNTHWFNFLAMKTCVLFGLEKTSQLRWFTLLSSGVFLTTVYFWIKSFKDIPIKVFAFSVALLNPFLIDYLSLARGYSTALMFEVLSITFYYIASTSNKRNLSLFSLFLAGMAAIANFNFFYFFVAFSLLYFYRYYFRQGFNFLRNKLFYIESFFAFGIAALVIKALQFITTCSNDIGAYGGEDLVNSIFVSFINTLVYKNYIVNHNLTLLLAYSLFSLLVIFSGVGIWKFRKHKCLWYVFASGLFLLMIILMIFNKWALGVLYPTDRTLLMLYPIIAMVIVGFIHTTLQKHKLKLALLYVISFLLSFNFLMGVSVTKSFDYYEQADTKVCFEFLDSINAKKVGLDPKLFGVYRNYYQLTDKYAFKFLGESINTDCPNGIEQYTNKLKNYEYLVLFPPYNLSFYKNACIRLKGIKYYQRSGTLVARVLY